MEHPRIVFVSGLPRSGSTLLLNLLGQNPQYHVTPTNALLNLLATIHELWQHSIEFKAQGVETIRPRILSMLRAMLVGFYRPEFDAGKVVFDKSRGWLEHIELAEQLLQRPVTVLVTVRDIRAIVASFENLIQRNPVTSLRAPDYHASQIMEGRVAMLLERTGVIGLPIARLRSALSRKHNSKILLIPYNELCRHPEKVLRKIENELKLPAFKYDSDHVQQLTKEDDGVYGLPLHNIREKVALSDPKPWENILPEAVSQQLVKDYADIQICAGATVQRCEGNSFIFVD